MKFSFINLTGLSLALSIFLTIILLVKHELSFDKFHSKSDRIYQVIQEFGHADGSDPEIFTSLHLSKALRSDLSVVENAVTIHGAQSTWAEVNGKRFFEEEGIIAGPQFFAMFDFNLKYGKPEEVLNEKRSIVLTESLARKFFEFEDPIGQEIDLDSYGRFTVSGVMNDVPPNSYIQFEFIITQDYDTYFEQTASWYPGWFQSWEGNGVTTYVLLDDPSNKDIFENQVSELLTRYLDGDKAINRHYLLGLEDLHFNSHGIDGRVNEYVKGDFNQVQFLIVIAVIILSMACFNYINISTSRYTRRTREVGVRKVMGAYNRQVTSQFLVESFIMVMMAFSIGLILVQLLLPYFSKVTGINLELDTVTIIQLSPYFLLTIVLVTLLAGFYPAFHLSRFPAISVLKNLTISNKGSGYLRKALVTIQYVFVISILAALLIINGQYSYMNSESVGFDTEELVVVEINGGGVRQNFASMKNELLQNSEILNVTGLTRMISGYRSGTSITISRNGVEKDGLAARFYGMDYDGLSTLGIELVAGEGFKGINSIDSTSIILNETAAELYGGTSVIGNILEVENEDGEMLKSKVIGISKDFHYRSLHDPIGPVVLGFYQNPFVSLDDIVIRLGPDYSNETLQKIEAIHNEYDSNDVMTWEFMDDMTQRAYEKELVFRDVFVGASVISFLIAILGLVGLISYNVMSRTKEIGIRKILGASFLSIMNMEAKELVRYLAISSMISVPLSWWFTSSWLLNFEYRISISPLIFITVILFILLTTFLIILLVAHKTAKSPPIDAIRYE